MRIVIASLFLLVAAAGPLHAEEASSKPEVVIEKMSVKLVRGVTNIATSVVELPKQTKHTYERLGAQGIIIGPLKGVGMTLYRTFIGVVETVAFAVPAPGYYDPMIDPPYVWQDWNKPQK